MSPSTLICGSIARAPELDSIDWSTLSLVIVAPMAKKQRAALRATSRDTYSIHGHLVAVIERDEHPGGFVEGRRNVVLVARDGSAPRPLHFPR